MLRVNMRDTEGTLFFANFENNPKMVACLSFGKHR